ncbi:MAG TPA: anti-sigma factor [Anaeromyxobacteraceae bacterium]|nr:anti-sigma factor [Anaeromyxobacteraceae bacterium]
MTCADVVELAGAYALGALEPDERAEVEAHLAGPGPHACRAAVDRARATAAALAQALPEVRPGPEVWRAIEARTGGSSRPRRVRIGSLGWAAVAAAAVALVFLQLERMESGRQRDHAQAALAERDRLWDEVQGLAAAGALQRDALALLDSPGTRLVPLEPQPGQLGRAVAIVNVAEGRAVVTSSSLPAQPGKTYQLWVIRGTAPPRPAGFLSPTPGGAAGELPSGAEIPSVLRRRQRGSPPGATIAWSACRTDRRRSPERW